MVAANRCHNDNSVLVKGTHAYRQTVSGRVFTGTAPARVCPTCGEKFIAAKDLIALDREVARRIAREGPVDGESFRFMRKALRMKAADLATLLDVTPETVSKWENAKNPVQRAAWMVVAEMVLDEAGNVHAPMKARLDAIARGRRPRKRVKLDAA